MKVVVIGASTNPSRTSNQAIHMLEAAHHEVIAIGAKEGRVGNSDIITERPAEDKVHTVTLYINPTIQPQYYDYIISLKPERVIFNPGTENQEFMSRLISKGIKIDEACTLVLIRTNQF